VNNKVLSLDLKTDGESLVRTVCGSEFQTLSAEYWKAPLEKSVLVNAWTSSVACCLSTVTSLIHLGNPRDTEFNLVPQDEFFV